jgi:hypothetical protein
MKRCVVFTVMACLSFTTASRAMPLDSPDIVYIDGIACNRPCQSYMAWSRQVLNRAARDSWNAPNEIAPPVAARSKPVVHDRVMKRIIPRTAETRPAKIATLPKVANHLSDSSTKPQETTTKQTQPPVATEAEEPDTTKTIIADTKPDAQKADTPDVTKSGTVGAALAEPLDGPRARPSANDRPESSGPTATEAKRPEAFVARPNRPVSAGLLPDSIREQVMAAAAIAELATLEPPKSPGVTGASSADRKADDSTDRNANALVALLISRPEINSVSDLAGKDVAIDHRYSSSEDRVKTALVTGGAADVQLSGNDTMALDRLLKAEVPAAVVILVSPAAAKTFPEIAGFKVFKIPLAPR